MIGTIRVYDETEKLFDNNGIKALHPLFAEITKIKDSDYYLELEDVIDNLEYYQKGLIISATTPKTWGDRPFQCFRCDNPIIQNNRISCKAWHLSYDSENYVINSATATNKNCNDAINHYNDNTDSTSPFTVFGDTGDTETTTMEKKTLFGVFTELLNHYGGHWYRDNFKFGIPSSIGEDRGVVLAYNKNITDIKVEENWDDVCTKLLPYVKDGDTVITLGEADEAYVELGEMLYDIPYTKVLEFKRESKDESDKPTTVEGWQGWLRSQAVKYLEENKHPKVNYSVSANLDNVSDVGDVIHVKHPKIIGNGKYLETEVLTVKYDAIRGRYTKIEFGNFKKEIKNLAQEVASIVETDNGKKLEETSGLLHAKLDESTAKINSVLSDGFVINNGNEFLAVDRLPKEEAVYCLKINRSGIGFSQTGIYGTFTSAWTLDGTLDMQAINVINLTASLIKGGTLKLGGTNNSSGNFELYDNSNRLMALMDKTGLTVYATNGDYVKLNADEGFAGYNRQGIKIYWADGDIFRMKNAEVENEIKIAGKIKIVPVSTEISVGVGFVALA